jgi:ribonucleoside-diphosphate reductase alpha chain
MHGTGVGVSVESRYVNKLPTLKPQTTTPRICVFADSKEGWHEGCNQLLHALYDGFVPAVDVSQVRPAGTRLATFGGKASGPEPLQLMATQISKVFREARMLGQTQLTPLQCLDIICYIAQSVVVGGTRRSALIALSDLNDVSIQRAKHGDWYATNPQRSIVNISAVCNDEFDDNEWKSLATSGSGERGIFNRTSLERLFEKTGRPPSRDTGCNPCSEIALLDKEMCNVSECIARVDDTLDALKDKVANAVIVGMYQATLSDFKLINPKYKENCEAERLLGVSITGIMDCKLINIDAWKVNRENVNSILRELRAHAHTVAKTYATSSGFTAPKAITCVKPSGTVSQIVNSSSGIHHRYAPYYIRRVTASPTDDLTTFMIKAGYPYDVKNNNILFKFYIKSPTCIQTPYNDIEFLQYVIDFQNNWCDHKVSATITVDNWETMGEFVKQNIADICGVAFFPRNSSKYELPPYEQITKDEYESYIQPIVDWDTFFEYRDNTTSSQSPVCTSKDGCEA